MAIRPPPIDLPPGMTASQPRNSNKYYVIAPTQAVFAVWVRKVSKLPRGPQLQDCNYLGTIASMKGLGFHNPDVELVVVNDGHKGKGEEYFQAACALISQYCLDKRLHDCKRDIV